MVSGSEVIFSYSINTEHQGWITNHARHWRSNAILQNRFCENAQIIKQWAYGMVWYGMVR